MMVNYMVKFKVEYFTVKIVILEIHIPLNYHHTKMLIVVFLTIENLK